jgi:hypothetical protein
MSVIWFGITIMALVVGAKFVYILIDQYPYDSVHPELGDDRKEETYIEKKGRNEAIKSRLGRRCLVSTRCAS